MSKNHKARKTCRGQMLLEVLIVLSVALVIITSILGLINADNRKATLARQTSEATKLDQEGLEIVRSIKDTNAHVVKVGHVKDGTLCINIGNFCTWSDLYSTNSQRKLDAHLSDGFLVGNPPSDPAEIVSLGSTYRRTITISDVQDPVTNEICSTSGLGPEQVKKVTVTVEWDNPTGIQSKKATECLTN